MLVVVKGSLLGSRIIGCRLKNGMKQGSPKRGHDFGTYPSSAWFAAFRNVSAIRLMKPKEGVSLKSRNPDSETTVEVMEYCCESLQDLHRVGSTQPKRSSFSCGEGRFFKGKIECMSASAFAAFLRWQMAASKTSKP